MELRSKWLLWNPPNLVNVKSANSLDKKPFDTIGTSSIEPVRLVSESDFYEEPRIEKETLIIPFNCHPKYKWWATGQSTIETLKELDASTEVIQRYKHSWEEFEERVAIVQFDGNVDEKTAKETAKDQLLKSHSELHQQKPENNEDDNYVW